MGTRADFYIGIDSNAEWIGSIAWDGYPGGVPDGVLCASSEAQFREAVDVFFSGRDDVSRPADGWPWPWADSTTSDYAYALNGDRVLVSCADGWVTPAQLAAAEQEYEETGNEPELDGIPFDFPNMKDRANVQLGGAKSGLIVVGF